jgi:hypothetical protein
MLIPNNGCPPPVVATVTQNPCTCKYKAVNMVAIRQDNKHSKQAYHNICGALVVHVIVCEAPIWSYIRYLKLMYMLLYITARTARSVLAKFLSFLAPGKGSFTDITRRVVGPLALLARRAASEAHSLDRFLVEGIIEWMIRKGFLQSTDKR